MSGFVRKSLRLVFDDPELEGFEVRARRLSIDELLDVTALRSLAGAKDDSEEVRASMAKVYAVLGGDPETAKRGVLLSWNLEEPVDERDPDGPKAAVPLSAETLARQDMPLLMSIVNAIAEATTAVPRPLEATSSAGVPSVELSLPMEPLSPSQPN